MYRLAFSVLLLFVVGLVSPSIASCHFVWLVQTGEGADKAIQLYFGEHAEADDPALLDLLSGVSVMSIDKNGESKVLELKREDESLAVDLPGDAEDKIFALKHTWGVMTRGAEPFLLKYYAKSGPEVSAAEWKQIDCSSQLELDLVPELDGKQVRVKVLFKGQPIEKVQVKVNGPGIQQIETTTDSNGLAVFPIARSGKYEILARNIVESPGTHEGDTYAAERHYTTLALDVASGEPADESESKPADAEEPSTAGLVDADRFPALPETVTSFGAAIVNGKLYVYGGHTGRAHEYYREAQANRLWELELKPDGKWRSLGEGPRLQGLAMVAHDGKLYRIGGFTAKNSDGDEQDLWSQSNVGCYDVATDTWNELPPLPEPRSSFDAAVLGDQIYVVGGWKMSGDASSVWHSTAYSMNLKSDEPEWEKLPEPPFKRRALAIAAHDGKLFVVGGMREEGGPTTRVDIYDPASKSWKIGPKLDGEFMDGFGASAFATGGRLYVSTYSGKLFRLAADESGWEEVMQLERDRFFHRMLPLSSTELLSVGGASMQSGKFEELDVINVAND